MLESSVRGGLFVTLTYAEEPVVPSADGVPVPTLVVRDSQLFHKRLRRRFSYRHATVGEYGSLFGRPHYHSMVFPSEPISWRDARDAIAASWQAGTVDVREFTVKRAAYLCGYTTKKLQAALPDEAPLHGVTLQAEALPEFQTWSKKPAIGLCDASLDWLLYLNQTPEAVRYRRLELLGDVIPEFRLGGKRWPLGSVAKNKLRDRLGITRTGPGERYLEGRSYVPRGTPELDLESVSKAAGVHDRMRRLKARRTGDVL